MGRKTSELATLGTYDAGTQFVMVYDSSEAAEADQNKKMVLTTFFDPASPPAIGGTSAAAGTFTSLNATGGGSLTGTWSDLGTVTTIDINGGTIDGTVIGGTTPAAVNGTTGLFTGTNVTIAVAGTPRFVWNKTDAGSNERIARFFHAGSSFGLQTRTDADASGSIMAQWLRSGTAITAIDIGNPTDNPDVTMYGNAVIATAGKLIDLSAGGFVKHASTAGIVAGTTQTQAGATALTTEFNVIGTCANANDGVKLPTAVPGLEIRIRNNGANAAQIWPNSNDAIDGGSADAVDPSTLAAGEARVYTAYSVSQWTTGGNS